MRRMDGWLEGVRGDDKISQQPTRNPFLYYVITSGVREGYPRNDVTTRVGKPLSDDVTMGIPF